MDQRVVIALLGGVADMFNVEIQTAPIGHLSQYRCEEFIYDAAARTCPWNELLKIV